MSSSCGPRRRRRRASSGSNLGQTGALDPPDKHGVCLPRVTNSHSRHPEPGGRRILAACPSSVLTWPMFSASPGAFAWRVLKGFRANQGLLLAGAVAYYALLSIVPLLILSVIALSHLIDQAELLQTLGRYLEWVMPGQGTAIVQELSNFLAHRDVIGWVLLVTMLFFSSLAFTVLENAMSVIFLHRVDGAAAPVRGFGPVALSLHPVPGLRTAGRHGRGGRAPGHGRRQRAPAGPGLVAQRRVRTAAVPAGSGGRDLPADLGVHGDAGGAAVLAPCADRRRDGGLAVGGHAPRAGLVLRDACRRSTWSTVR